TTPMRNPAGIGSCCAMISLTLATAVGVNVTGGALGVVSIFGCVVVAMALLLMKLQYISGLRELKLQLLDDLIPREMQISRDARRGESRNIRQFRASAERKFPAYLYCRGWRFVRRNWSA